MLTLVLCYILPYGLVGLFVFKHFFQKAVYERVKRDERDISSAVSSRNLYKGDIEDGAALATFWIVYFIFLVSRGGCRIFESVVLQRWAAKIELKAKADIESERIKKEASKKLDAIIANDPQLRLLSNLAKM